MGISDVRFRFLHSLIPLAFLTHQTLPNLIKIRYLGLAHSQHSSFMNVKFKSRGYLT